MKIVIKIVAGLALLLLGLALVSFAFPRHYRVERSVVINAPAEAVRNHVANLDAWKRWGAWQERDPGMKLSYSAPATGVGAWSAWESKQEGNGRMTITEQTPTRTAYQLEFPDMGTRSNGVIELHVQADGVKVVWTDTGDLGMNPIMRWFGLFLDKSIIGPDFERGLANLKRLLEK